MVFTVLGAVVELERALIVERVKAGLRNAKAKGKRLGRPRVHLDSSRITTLRRAGRSWNQIAQETGLDEGDGTKSLLRRKVLSWLAQRRPARFWAGDRGSDFVRLLVNVRVQNPTQIHTNAERIAAQVKRNAAAKVKFEVHSWRRFVVDASVPTIVSDKISAACRNASRLVALSIRGCSGRAALRGRAATEHAAEYRLIAPRCDVVSRRGEAELTGVILQAPVELSVVTEGYEWTVEKPRVHDSVADSGVKEWGEIPEGVVDVIQKIPCSVARAEAFLSVASGGGQMDRRAIVKKVSRISPSEVREESSYADPGDRAGIILLDRRGGADKIKGDTCVHSEVTRKIVPKSRAHVIHPAVATIAAFEPCSQRPPRGKTGIGGGTSSNGSWGLRE